MAKIHLLLIFFISCFWLIYAQRCSQSNPCEKGCCSKFGYCGYGPDYCAKDVCVDRCEEKSECRHNTWPSGFSTIDQCPLNVCCSRFGFCGTTKDFCGDTTVKRPQCDAKSSRPMARVVGYYETWGPRRPCHKFMPAKIPVGVYTHINIAFATIDPSTFQIRPSHTEDVELYQKLAQLKQFDPDVRIYIAIGGWAFNDPGPTRNIFSDIAKSLVNQRAFFRSLTAFLSAFDFDGVDLDWEYPGADDRGGNPEDFANFPKFIANLKDTLKSTSKSGLSITLPASYWYLQHFDIKKLARHVEFFNIMSYDIHGLWDRDNKWTGPWLNAHTNLTEITEALDLLWRSEINPDQVVMGIGFYGRAFTATSSSCLKAGCQFKDAGKPGKCSREGGILTNSEIIDIIKEKNLRPTLYKTETVKAISWDDQWVAYDDAQTIKMKAEFARSQCLGGLMAWAITHDMDDARFSLALGEAAGRKTILSLPANTPYETSELVDRAQCRWTSCGEICPHGFTAVERQDGGARDKKGPELMLDGTGCDGKGIATFCCPSDLEIPVCGWYGHRNGKCSPGCPKEMSEVGRNSQYCNNDKYQSACCSKIKSVSVYDTCYLTKLQGCWEDKTETCKAEYKGFGFYHTKIDCWDSFIGEHQSPPSPELCCTDHISNNKIDDCEYFDNIGDNLPGASNSNACKVGCPANRLRMATDDDGGRCGSDGGARANCCKATVQDYKLVNDETAGELKLALTTFLQNPVCFNPGYLHNPFKPSSPDNFGEVDLGGLFGDGTGGPLEIGGTSGPNGAIHRRAIAMGNEFLVPGARFNSSSIQQRPNYHHVRFLVGWLSNAISLMLRNAPFDRRMGRQAAIWDLALAPERPDLQMANIQRNVHQWQLAVRDAAEAANELMCNIQRANEMMRWMREEQENEALREERRKQHYALDCDWDHCNREGCPLDPSVGQWNPDAEEEPLKRFAPRAVNAPLMLRDAISVPTVGAKRSFPVKCTLRNGTPVAKLIKSRPYPQAADTRFKADNREIFDRAYDFAHILDCNNIFIAETATADGNGFDVEHIIELNTVSRFLNDITAGVLASSINLLVKEPYKTPIRKPLPLPALPCEFVDQALNELYLPKSVDRMPASPGSPQFRLRRPADRVFDALGSTTNRENLVFLRSSLNTLKNRIWMAAAQPYAEPVMQGYLDANPPQWQNALTSIRDVFVVFAYFNDPRVQSKMVNICNRVRDQLVIIENEWNSRNQADKIHLADLWDVWIRSAFDAATQHGMNFVQTWISEMNAYFTAGKQLTQTEIGVRETLRAYGLEAFFITINTSGLR